MLDSYCSNGANPQSYYVETTSDSNIRCKPMRSWTLSNW
jgi:hypothetical protein